MSKKSNLFDLLMRHQVYLEGVKLGVASQYTKSLRKLYTEFSRLLMFNKYTSMDQFTKAELLAFIREFTQIQNVVYGEYLKQLLSDLQDFVAVDLTITQAILEQETNEAPDEQEPSKLWSSINNSPIPANGYFVSAYPKTFVTAAAYSVVAMLQRAYANAWTMKETFENIVGTSDKYFTDGLFSKSSAQNSSMINTILQHESSIIQAKVASQFFDFYTWVAILDSRTTVICFDRHGNVYKYGEGPLPPAHYNCRSKVIPKESKDQVTNYPDTYSEWISTQPELFQNDVLGNEKASSLRSGELGAKDFKSIQVNKALTIPQFGKKIEIILAV